MNRVVKSAKDAIRAVLILAIQNFLFFKARDLTRLAGAGPILVIAPHPDDETLGCGAFIARARYLRQKVRIVIVTDGRLSPMPTPKSPDRLAQLRREEAAQAATILGVNVDDLVFLDVPDGQAASHQAIIENGLRQQIAALQPKLIISPYGVDSHEDHRAVAAVVDQLCRTGAITCRILEYPVWFWLRDGIRHIAKDKCLPRLRRAQMYGYSGAKMLAMKAHRSQCPHLFGEDSPGSFFQPLSFHAQFFDKYELFFEKTNL